MSENYWQNLPKKRMGAGMLIFDKQNRLLIVKPTYKDGWTIPGGVVDENESPKEACIREVKEETGLNIKNPKFLCIAYHRNTDSNKGESLQFLFYGGELNSSDVADIKLQEKELSEYKFIETEEALKLVNSALAERIKISLEKAIKEKKPFYFEL